MAESLKEKLEETGQKISEKTTEMGHKVAETVEEAADWTKEKARQAGHRIEETAQKVEDKFKGTTVAQPDIREHMPVFGSCGQRLGTVDHVEGDKIKLTRDDSADGHHHWIPCSWVSQVRDSVTLSKNCGEARQEWESE